MLRIESAQFETSLSLSVNPAGHQLFYTTHAPGTPTILWGAACLTYNNLFLQGHALQYIGEAAQGASAAPRRQQFCWQKPVGTHPSRM